jgi:hypothetical protein
MDFLPILNSNFNNISCIVNLSFSYNDEALKISDVTLNILNNNCVDILDLCTELFNHGIGQINNTAISYYDPELKIYIFCGVYPNLKTVLIPLVLFKAEGLNCKGPDTNAYEISLRSRFIPVIDEKLKMILIDEDHEHTEESNSGMLGKKSRRSKERKLGYIIEKVFLWRKLFNGYKDDNKGFVKLTLEDAAQKVGISKKSLDDYLNQLKNGKQAGFNYNDNKNSKVGVLRAYIKKKR